MVIPAESLVEISRYIERNQSASLFEKSADFDRYIRHIKKFHPVDATTNMLEIGTGTGWFPLLCAANGLRCKGLEISPQLINYAKWLGSRHGIEANLELGNIETADLGEDQYDVIVAMSVFEHVEFWEEGLRRVYRALKKGGIVLFESTNKFSPVSGEYRAFPLYGWLTDKMRYRLRMARHGKQIMRLGIDFNQFRYPMLRREFRRIGFRQIYDRLSLIEPERILNPVKRLAAEICVEFAPFGALALAFMPTTNFVCVK
jgi:2-polyprenyl-3-methyl-5-hydroxy-6-metoxy-1,4-benzoquinol methylase